MYFSFKNSLFALTLFLGFNFHLFSQLNQVDEKGRKQGVWMKTYDDDHDLIRYKGQFKDNRPVGKFIYYYPNGKVRSIINHDENSNRSEAYFYHLNEKLIAHGIY